MVSSSPETVPATENDRAPRRNPPPPARPANLPALTGLRFLLALWVIVNHLVGKGHVYEPAAQFLPGPLQAIMRGGYLAVPTFFMLSGVVLARTYSAISWNRQTLWKYAAGRFARVYPVYLLSLLIVAPFIVKAQDQPKAWLVAMHLTLLQAWWVGHYTAGWNTPAWSLSGEMFFYLVFPVFVLRWKKLGWIATLATATLACALTKLLWAAGISDQLKPVIHLADFLMGIAIARALELITAQHALKAGRWPSGKWLYATGILGSALLIGYAQYLPDSPAPHHPPPPHERPPPARLRSRWRLASPLPRNPPPRLPRQGKLQHVHPPHPHPLVGRQLARNPGPQLLRRFRNRPVLHRLRGPRRAPEPLPPFTRRPQRSQRYHGTLSLVSPSFM